MVILQVVHDFLERARAGTEIYTYRLSRELMRRGHRVALFFCEPRFTLHSRSRFQKGSFEGMAVYKIRKWPLGELSFHDPFMEAAFEEALDETRPDLVHFQHLYGMSLRLPELAKGRGIPTLFTLHDHWLLCPMVRLYNYRNEICRSYGANCTRCSIAYEYISQGINVLTDYGRPKGLARILFPPLLIRELDRYLRLERKDAIKRMVENVDLFLAMSEKQRDMLVRELIEENRIRYMGHGLPFEGLEGLRKVPRSGKVRFMYLGQVARHKGVDLLIRAFNRVDPEKAELRIYGRVTDPLLRLLVKNPGIHLMGPVRGAEKEKAFSNADLLVAPSRCYETGPMVVLEAMAAGIPVIVSDTTAVALSISEQGSGLVFKAGNVEDLEEKIMQLLSDPTRIDDMSGRIRPTAITGMEEHVEAMEALYRELT